MKRIISFLLAVTMVFAGIIISYAAEPETKLYEIYGNDMLFQQNEEAILSGVGNGGSVIEAELYNSANELAAKGKSSVNRNGTFEVSFTAPSGSYEEYTIIISSDGTEFARLERVVFGELWLASGQSNMQYPLGQAKHGFEMMMNGEKQSKWLRILLVPAYNEYKGSTDLLPADPQENIIGAKWITGEDSSVYGMSAVAFFFADKMLAEIDMPIGILNASLGGTSIRSWISREALDGAPEVKGILEKHGHYIEKSDWTEEGRNVYGDMTGNYNTKIESLKRFRPVGMIWYQGESDLMSRYTVQEYAAQFDLLQSSYSELFGYENELMPVIYTQLAAYVYDSDPSLFLDFNIGFTEMDNETRSSITVYDVPLTFIPEAGSIHPENKKEFGERMADAALRIVHSKDNNSIVPTVKNHEIKNSSIYVTLENTGNGLMFNGEKAEGFAICAEDGIYVKADAEIISSDTVRIWSEYVPNPVSASYAYSLVNLNANLFSSMDGRAVLPVCQFVTKRIENAHYWCEKPWIDCEQSETFHTHSDTDTGFYPSWKSENATIDFNAKKYIDVEGNGSFSVSPVLNFTQGNKTYRFEDTDYDYSDYGSLIFLVKNNGKEEVSLEMLKIYTNSSIWYSPMVSGTHDINAVIPADGEWHKITLDLNSLYLFGNECGITFPKNKLKKIYDINFCLSSTEKTRLSIDEISFSPSSEEIGVRFEAKVSNADTPFEWLSAVFVGIIGAISRIF